jgi:hypothetical protein
MRYQNLKQKLHKPYLQQTTFPKTHHPFHPRVVNSTYISFTDKEMELLEKGPKYNLHQK